MLNTCIYVYLFRVQKNNRRWRYARSPYVQTRRRGFSFLLYFRISTPNRNQRQNENKYIISRGVPPKKKKKTSKPHAYGLGSKTADRGFIVIQSVYTRVRFRPSLPYPQTVAACIIITTLWTHASHPNGTPRTIIILLQYAKITVNTKIEHKRHCTCIILTDKLAAAQCKYYTVMQIFIRIVTKFNVYDYL